MAHDAFRPRRQAVEIVFGVVKGSSFDAPFAHIHLEVTHGGGTLGTEIVFDGPSPAASVPPTARTLPIALTRTAGTWHGAAVFVFGPG